MAKRIQFQNIQYRKTRINAVVGLPTFPLKADIIYISLR